MLTKIVDCCHLSAQENEPRVTFTTEFYKDRPITVDKTVDSFDDSFVDKTVDITVDKPMHAVRREHIPLSAAMQIIATDRQIPNGFYECYLIAPEDD